MSDTSGNELNHPVLNLTAEEKRAYGQLFQQADTDRLGVVTGEIAVKFFEKTRVAPSVLGEIWQIADSENRGLLTKPGFCVALRLIGHYQAGRDPTPELGFRPSPIPKFDGITIAPASPAISAPPVNPIQAQGTGPIRVPPLNAEKIAQYSGLFERSGAQNGALSGESARAIFERAGLPNEILGRIWTLSDRDQKGALGITEFIIAMHLITSYKSRAMTALPSVLPPGLYEAASRRGPPAQGRAPGIVPQGTGSIPRQFTGPQRTQSPLTRPAYATPPPQAAQPAVSNWLITPQEKAKYDTFFNNIDTAGSGFLTGEQAVKFFSDSGLSEDALASIWDLADIRSEGQLNRDEFAVAMYLIRQQRSGAAPLPAFLPAALMPPSMRNQPAPPPQPTAPAFDNAANSSQLPKSASEDLFGLDASPPRPAPVQTQQATGGSTSVRSPFDSDPFEGSKPSSPVSPQRQAFQTPQQTGQSIFKPFMPTSAFGASLATQHTGGSVASSQGPPRGPPQPPPTQRSIQQPSAIDDLLGDNEEDQNQKLTQETTELANMSSQVGNLRNQMQEVQTKKTTGERDLQAASSQKQELQQRLAQFRAQYEQEVQIVKSLEQQLAGSRESTKKLQQEFAMLEGTQQDLQTQHQQVSQALEADQRENGSLKERISQLNAQVTQLRPQIEKLRSDARQQKGLVAINKKQLATSEGDHEKLNSELSELKAAEEERKRTVAEEERRRNVAEEERRRNVQTTTEPPSTVVSPAPSTSTNPFFRKASTQGESRGLQSPGGSIATTANASAFDALFGPSSTSTQQPQGNAPPQVSFARSENAPAASGLSGQSASSDGRPTPSATPPLSGHGFPAPNEAPPPLETRQFTPGILPMRPPISRGTSVNSSVRAAPPASALDPSEGTVTSPNTVPNTRNVSSAFGPDHPIAETASRNVSSPFAFDDANANSGTGSVSSPYGDNNNIFRSSPFGESNASVDPTPQRGVEEPRPQPTSQGSTASIAREVPGAFPDDVTSPMNPIQSNAAGKKAVTNDFDSAFSAFDEPSLSKGDEQASDPIPSLAGQKGKSHEEFPPIQDLAQDDSDSDDDTGFDDDFAGAQSHPNGAPAIVSPGETEAHDAQRDALTAGSATRPELTTANSALSDLPAITAQKSPPTYDETMSPDSDMGGPGRTSNSFPPEFQGLLPSREDPTTTALSHSVPENTGRSPTASAQSLAPPQTPASTVDSDIYQDASSRPLSTWTDAQDHTRQASSSSHTAPAHSKSAFDDAFDDFDGLDEAKTADDKGFDFPDNRSENEFNPTFDSPANSTFNTATSPSQTPVARGPQRAGSNAFDDFESSVSHHQSQPSISTAFGQSRAGQTPQASNHDWDAIFSGLDTPAPNVDPNYGSASASHGQSPEFNNSVAETPTPKASSPVLDRNEQAPPLTRALSAGTEHDDPILKRLTGMGYPRTQALNALEQYDYDINKAVDHLSSSR